MAIFNRSVKYTKEQLLKDLETRDSLSGLILKYLYGIIRFICIIIQNLYCVSSYLVLSWIVLLPISWLRNELYSKLENYLYNSLLFIVSSWSLAGGAMVVESGDEYKHLIEEPENHYPDDHGRLAAKNSDNDVQRKHQLNNSLKHHGGKNITDKQNNNKSELAIIRNDVIDGNVVHMAKRMTKDYLSNDVAYVDYKNKLAKNERYDKLSGTICYQNSHRLNGYNEQQLTTNGSHVGGDSEDELYLSENSPGMIEYQIELASAAGERKLIQRSYRPDYNTENNNSLLNYSGRSIISSNLISTNNKRKLTANKSLSNVQQQQQEQQYMNNTNINREKLSRQKQAQMMSISSPKPLTNALTATLSASSESLKSMQAKPRILFLCNHISTADVPLLMQSFSTLTNQSILWVLDAQFKPTNFGVVCSSHGDFFVAKNNFVDGSLREQVLKHPDRNLLVLFPEGGFLRKRLEGSNRYAARNNYPSTKYVTHPRFGAFKDLIDPSVGVTHIVDTTLFYNDIKNPLSVLDITLGTRKEPAILNYKLYKRSEINPTEEWLRNIWLDKDKRLAKYYENRSSFVKLIEHSMRVAKLDWFKILAVHLFYLLVCYLAIFRLFNATSITMLKARELYYSNM